MLTWLRPKSIRILGVSGYSRCIGRGIREQSGRKRSALGNRDQDFLGGAARRAQQLSAYDPGVWKGVAEIRGISWARARRCRGRAQADSRIVGATSWGGTVDGVC